MMVPDVIICRECGNAKIHTDRYGAKICPKCDVNMSVAPKGETNEGGPFGPMPHAQGNYNHIRNSQMSEYGGNLRELSASYVRCKEIVKFMERGNPCTVKLGPQQVHDFANLFNLANIGKYYVCVQLKESADIHTDLGHIKPGDDPWGLGVPV